MKHSTSKPNKYEASRLRRVKEGLCVACFQEGWINRGCDAHHLLIGGKRLGHLFTVSLCGWHHRGLTVDGKSTKEMEAAFGPSLALTPKRFRNHFGTDADLLALTNKLLDEVTT